MGVRIHSLAKELDLPSKELITILQGQLGIKVANHLSSIEEGVAENLRKMVRGGGKPAASPPASKPAQVRAPILKPGERLPGSTAPPAPVAPLHRKIVRFVELPQRKQPIIVRPARPPERPPPPPPPRDRPQVAPPRRDSDRPPPPPLGKDGDRRRTLRIFPERDEAAQGRGRSGPHAPHGTHATRGARGTDKDRGRRPTTTPAGEETPSFVPQRLEIPSDRPSEVKIALPITLKDLSPIIGVKQNFVIKSLIEDGVIITLNQHLSAELLQKIGDKFKVKIETSEEKRLEKTLEEMENLVDPPESLTLRAPVVTFLGHVDHGKTSLLDKIRTTHVAASEAGGITQHMSAYRVDKGDKHVVFIDTPGHQAFTEMRARGANVTDVAVLVVAADDGVMPQTEEAIQHARAAGVPIVVAINKIDKGNANAPRVREQLSTVGLAPLEWGGTTEMVEVSARTSQGLDNLLELLSLETEVLQLRANAGRPALGTVLDAKKSAGRGIVVTVLIQKGTLRKGDTVVCGPAYGQVRTLQATIGTPLSEAGPSTPVEVTGLDDIPDAGDRFYALKDIQVAKDIAAERKRKSREQVRAKTTHVALDKLFDKIKKGETREVRLVVKADVRGTLEVLRTQLVEQATSEIGVRVIGDGVGEITESDILLADASDAIVLGFHVIPNMRARLLAEKNNIEVRTYQVIYELLNDVRAALEGMLAPSLHEEVQATVEIRQIFKASKLGNIAGSWVRSGTVRRDDPVRLIRDGKMIFQGKLASLKRFKDDAREVKEGLECGLRVHDYDDVQVGDIVESYRIIKKARTLADVAPR